MQLGPRYQVRPKPLGNRQGGSGCRCISAAVRAKLVLASPDLSLPCKDQVSNIMNLSFCHFTDPMGPLNCTFYPLNSIVLQRGLGIVAIPA